MYCVMSGYVILAYFRYIKRLIIHSERAIVRDVFGEVTGNALLTATRAAQ